MADAEAPAVSQPVNAPSPRATRLLLAVCFFVSGGAGVVYEVLWSRHLQVLFGSTTESVAAVLAVFMPVGARPLLSRGLKLLGSWGMTTTVCARRALCVWIEAPALTPGRHAPEGAYFR